MALHAPQALPSELGVALQTHLQKHFGGNATLRPHRAPMAVPQYAGLWVEPGICTHELPPRATICGAIVATIAIMATNVGATLAGMAIALAYKSAPGEYHTQVASGVGTSQEGEAMTLLLCVRRLAQHEGIYWMVPDAESAVGTLRTY